MASFEAKIQNELIPTLKASYFQVDEALKWNLCSISKATVKFFTCKDMKPGAGEYKSELQGALSNKQIAQYPNFHQKLALRKMFALSDANFVVRYLISTLNKPFLQVLTFINGTL